MQVSRKILLWKRLEEVVLREILKRYMKIHESITHLFHTNRGKELGKIGENGFRGFIAEISVKAGVQINPDAVLNRLDPMKTNWIHYSPCINLLSNYFVRKEEESLSLIQSLNLKAN